MAANPEISTRVALLTAAQSLCNDFSLASSTSTLLSHFSTSSSPESSPPSACEYGHSSLGPFLGRPFLGRTGIEEYFNLLQQHLTFENMRFSDYAIDETQKIVCVKGEATFTWTETGQSWDEVFTYRLGFMEEQMQGKKVWKIGRYEVWADSGSL